MMSPRFIFSRKKVTPRGTEPTFRTTESERSTRLKFAVIGYRSVGKSAIIRRFLFDIFPTDKILEIAPEEIEEEILDYYLYGHNAVLLVYDITRLETFEALEKYLDWIKGCFDQLPCLALIAGKTDLSDRRAVPIKSHNAFVRTNRLFSYQVSAKNGSNVIPMFHRIAADVLGLRLTNEYLINLGASLLSPISAKSNTPDPRNPEWDIQTLNNEFQNSSIPLSPIKSGEDSEIETIYTDTTSMTTDSAFNFDDFSDEEIHRDCSSNSESIRIDGDHNPSSKSSKCPHFCFPFCCQ